MSHLPDRVLEYLKEHDTTEAEIVAEALGVEVHEAVAAAIQLPSPHVAVSQTKFE